MSQAGKTLALKGLSGAVREQKLRADGNPVHTLAS